MIDDLDRTLAALLEQELPTDLAQQVHVSFAPPDSSFPPAGVTLPAIDLFLYDVRENTDLRSIDPIVTTENGNATETPAPVRIDCSYLVTAWPSDSSPTPAEDEHRLLGAVTLVLLANSTIPANVLQGSLQSQEFAPPVSALQPSRLQSAGEFWQALGGKPKASLNYMVTIALQTGQAVDLGPVVQERDTRFTQIHP